MDQTAQILTATGNVCHQWSYFEYLFAKVIWHFLGLDKQTGVIVTGGLDIRPGATMAVRLAEARSAPPDLIAALQVAQRSADSLAPKRNRVVHGVYSSDPTEVSNEVRVETHRRKDWTAKPIALSDIQAVGSDINMAAMTLVAALEQHNIDCN